MDILDVKNKAHSRFLDAKSIYTIVSGPRFTAAFENASDEERIKICEYIDNNSRSALDKLVEEISDRYIEYMTMRQLRLTAQKYGVPRYNYLPKASLLSEIKQREMAHERNIETNGSISGEIGDS